MQYDDRTGRPGAIDSTRTNDLATQALTAADATNTSANRDSVAGKVQSATDEARVTAAGWLDDLKVTIRENPMTSVGVVAALGYIWGVTR